MPSAEDIARYKSQISIQNLDPSTGRTSERNLLERDEVRKDCVLKWFKQMTYVGHAIILSVLVLVGFKIGGFYLEQGVLVALIVTIAGSSLIVQIRKAVSAVLPF